MGQAKREVQSEQCRNLPFPLDWSKYTGQNQEFESKNYKQKFESKNFGTISTQQGPSLALEGLWKIRPTGLICKAEGLNLYHC